MIRSYYLFMMETLFHGGVPAKGAVELLRKMQEKGMPYVILSEQCGKPREELAANMNFAGFRNINAMDIYTSSLAAVDWIMWHSPDKNKAAMIGGRGMRDAIVKGGMVIDHVSPDWLFLGMNKTLSYVDYSDALQVLEEGAELIVTDERRIQIKDGIHMIGNGAVAHMLEYASGKEAVSFGRGSERFLKQAMKYFDVTPESLTMVGTDFEKDIVPAIKFGMNTVFVTQGRSIMDLGISDEVHPDYIVEDLSGLAK